MVNKKIKVIEEEDTLNKEQKFNLAQNNDLGGSSGHPKLGGLGAAEDNIHGSP